MHCKPGPPRSGHAGAHARAHVVVGSVCVCVCVCVCDGGVLVAGKEGGKANSKWHADGTQVVPPRRNVALTEQRATRGGTNEVRATVTAHDLTRRRDETGKEILSDLTQG